MNKQSFSPNKQSFSPNKQSFSPNKQSFSPNKLRKMTILLVTHSRTTGFSQMLRNWLKDKVQTLIYIDNPLYPTKKLNSSLVVYKNGILKQSCQSRYLFSPGILLYVKDLLTTLCYVFKSKERFDLAIGVDNLNTFSLLFIRKIGRVKKVIYHTVDYTPQRFANKILNKIYHAIDKYCCYNADMIWNSSGRMNEGRIKNGMDRNKIAKSIITPDGSNFNPKKRLPISKIERYKIVFLGHLREGMGLELLVSSFPDILRRCPRASLLIIGDGPLLAILRQMVEKAHLDKNVILTGFLKSHEKVDNLLRKAAIGVAPFEPRPEAIEFYSDVGKPKVYLSAGLPVVITKVPEIAYEIEKKRAGIAIEYDKKALVEAIISLLKDDKIYGDLRQNAISLSKKYVWGNIFSEAFLKSMNFFKHSENS